MVQEAGAKRRGRPPASDSTETRQEIIDCARRLFAERGYGGVTNKELAAAAGLTPGALYHYIESKLDLYVCVHRDLQRRWYGRFVAAVKDNESFLDRMERLIEVARAMNEEDPSLTDFFGTVRIDVRRFPEIQDKLAASEAATEDFFTSLADAGIATGEVCPERRAMVAEFLRVILVGITEGASATAEQHRLALDSVAAALRGELLLPRGPRGRQPMIR